MFTELYAIAKHTALTMLVTPRGDNLRVTIIPKPDEGVDAKSALAKPLQIEGTPAELDAELPAEISRYCGKANELRLRLDLPIEALEAELAKPARKKSTEATKPSAPKKAPAAKPRREKKAKPARKPSAPAAPRKPAAPSASAKRKAKKAPVPRASLPGKDKCVADLKAYMTTGASVTRAAFIAWARRNGNKTGRRYEKLWSSWDAFVAEGKQLDLLGEPAAESSPVEPEAPRERAQDPDQPATTDPSGGDDDQTAAAVPQPTENADTSSTAPASPEPSAPPAADEAPRAASAAVQPGNAMGELLDDLEQRLRAEGHLKAPAASGSAE